MHVNFEINSDTVTDIFHKFRHERVTATNDSSTRVKIFYMVAV